MLKKTFFTFLVVFIAQLVCGQQVTLKPKSWLISKTFSSASPAFDTLKNNNGERFNPVSALDYLPLPQKKQLPSTTNQRNEIFQWKSYNDTTLTFSKPQGKQNQLVIATCRIYANQFSKVNIKIKTNLAFKLFENNKSLTASEKFPNKKNITKETEVDWIRGDHLLTLKIAIPSNLDTIPWLSLSASGNNIKESAENTWHMDMEHVLCSPTISGIEVNSTGDFYILSTQYTNPEDGKKWIETKICRTDNNQPIRVYTSNTPDELAFTPDGKSIFYTENNPEGKFLIVENLSSFQQERYEGFDQAYNLRFTPDGSHVIYYININGPKDQEGVKRFKNMRDREPWYRNRVYLGSYNLNSGQHQRLTWGPGNTYLQDITHDSQTIFFTTGQEDYSKTPTTRQTLYSLNLNTLESQIIWQDMSDVTISVSPDDSKLLVQGSKNWFKPELTEQKELINDFNTQLFLYDLKSKNIEHLTKNYDPKILDAIWFKDGKTVILRVEDKTRVKLVQLNLSDKKFKEIETQPDVIDQFSTAYNGDKLIFSGSSLQYPSRAYICNKDGASLKLIADPSKEIFSQVVFGETKEFSFKAKNGDLIDGFYMLPPDFDRNKKYPVIVYYYGGTNPINRAFEGRYPKNFFASMGYVVYVVNPAGATGYGESFAAKHVNAWGITTADQIIEGTKKFLTENTWADSTNVGCIGASYGGFMTLYLLTQTKLFKAAISHAGISNLANYWGEGYWGYSYSETATTGKFPWNAQDFYMNQSPLFNSAKITTPLLLLHGNKDTNVPPSESHQMFAALKLQNKTVELIEIDGQDHHIVDYSKRLKWQYTILGWFDKWLKGEKDWWESQYPERSF